MTLNRQEKEGLYKRKGRLTHAKMRKDTERDSKGMGFPPEVHTDPYTSKGPLSYAWILPVARLSKSTGIQ